jgi:hypothetical protein
MDEKGGGGPAGLHEYWIEGTIYISEGYTA